MDLDCIVKDGLSKEVLKNCRADWSLAHDVKLLKFLEHYSKNLISRTKEALNGLDKFEKDLSSISLNIQTVSQRFQSLANKQFIEHCVLEEDVSIYSKPSKSTSEVSKIGSNVILKEALSSCLSTFNSKYYNHEDGYLNNRFNHFSSATSFSKNLPPLIGSDGFSEYYSEFLNCKKETKVIIPKHQVQEEIHDNNSELPSSQHSSSSNVDLDEDNYSFKRNLVTSANLSTCPSDNNSSSSDSDVNEKVTSNLLNHNQSSQWRPNDNFGINKGYSFAPPPPNQSLFDDDDEEDDLFGSSRSDLFIDNKSDLFDTNSNLPVEIDKNNGFVQNIDTYSSEEKSSTKINKTEEKNTPVSTNVNKSEERFVPPPPTTVKPQLDRKLNPNPFLFNESKTERSLFSGDSSDDDLWNSSTDLKKSKNQISDVKNTPNKSSGNYKSEQVFESDDNKPEKPNKNLTERQENKSSSALFNKETDSVPSIPSKCPEKTFKLFSEDSSDEELLWNTGNSNTKNNFKKLLEQKLSTPKSLPKKISSNSQNDDSQTFTANAPSSLFENETVESTSKVPEQERAEPINRCHEDTSLLPSYHTSTLESLSKNRAKIKNKRRPPSRKHLKQLSDHSDTLSSQDNSSFGKSSNQVSILSPSTEEEDLFVVPPNPIGHDSSNSNLFTASSLLSPGSSLDNQSLFADAISEINTENGSSTDFIEGDKSITNDSTINISKRTDLEPDKTEQSPNLKSKKSFDELTPSKEQQSFSEDIFEKNLSSDVEFKTPPSKASLDNSLSLISSEKEDVTSSHNSSDIFSNAINNDSLNNQLSSNSISHSPPPLFPSIEPKESKKEGKFFWNTNTSLFDDSSDDEDDLFGSKVVKKPDISAKNVMNSSKSSLRSKLNKDAAQDLFSSDDESLFKTNDKSTKQKFSRSEPANKPDTLSAAASRFKDPLSIFNDDAA